MSEPSEPIKSAVDEALERFEGAMQDLVDGVRALGFDPDSLLKCAEHQEFMFDPNNHFIPTEHYRHHSP
jgi:hypothetical protein